MPDIGNPGQFSRRKAAPGRRMLQGAATLALALFLPAAAAAVPFKTIHDFTGGEGGGEPDGKLTAGKDGTLYGTTSFGGPDNINGTVFQLVPNAGRTEWDYQVIYAFKGGADGMTPIGDIDTDDDGNIYGTTNSGGGGCNCGVVYKLSFDKNKAKWTEEVLHAFSKKNNDGRFPEGGVRVEDGAIYGTTTFGGKDFGTVFRLTPKQNGKYVYDTLYTFKGGSDGGSPVATVVFVDGTLYGTTSREGSKKGSCSQDSRGCGTVFKLEEPNGGGVPWKHTPLYLFKGEPKDGMEPNSRLASKEGVLYGTTREAGQKSCGTVFTHNIASGKTEVIYSFKCGKDGSSPVGVSFRQKTLLGVTQLGGSGINGPNAGTVFQLDDNGGAEWDKKILHKFSDGADGGIPQAPLYIDRDEAFATTYEGGEIGSGTVFQMFGKK